jgi:hypothetical protein
MGLLHCALLRSGEGVGSEQGEIYFRETVGLRWCARLKVIENTPSSATGGLNLPKHGVHGKVTGGRIAQVTLLKTGLLWYPAI